MKFEITETTVMSIVVGYATIRIVLRVWGV